MTGHTDLPPILVVMSSDSLNQRPPTKRIVPHQQQSAQRCQVVWQLAISARVHVADEQGGCFFQIALIKITERSLLAPLDIFVARHVIYQGTIHFRFPQTDDCFR